MGLSYRRDHWVSMDFLIVALAARLVGTAFLASLFGAGLWLLGTMLVASYSFGNEAAVLLSTWGSTSVPASLRGSLSCARRRSNAAPGCGWSPSWRFQWP